MPYPCGCFIGEEITSRCHEEVQYCGIFPAGRVRYVNHYRGTLQRLDQPLAGESIDSRVGGCRYRLVPMLTKFADKLRSDETSATDHYDFHGFAPFTFERRISDMPVVPAMTEHHRVL